MAWVLKIPAREHHLCIFPNLGLVKVAQGSAWQCDDCGRIWEVHQGPNLGDYSWHLQYTDIVISVYVGPGNKFS